MTIYEMTLHEIIGVIGLIVMSGGLYYGFKPMWDTLNEDLKDK